MNRQQRRKLKRQEEKRSPVYQFNLNQVNSIKESSFQNGMSSGIAIEIALIAKLLKDSYDFSKNEINEFIKKLSDLTSKEAEDGFNFYKLMRDFNAELGFNVNVDDKGLNINKTI